MSADMTNPTVPAWWLTDPEHAPALMAFELIHRSHHIRRAADDATDQFPGSWIIDFEAVWAEPMSSGERILVALAWCLYNLGWASEVDPAGEGPLYWSNPSRAAGTLGGRHLDCYLEMIRIHLGVRS